MAVRFPSSFPDLAAPARPPRRRRAAGFTLLEVLVATAILAMLVAILATALSSSSRTIRRAGEQLEAFREARAAFDALGRTLRTATLNTYWGYDDPNQPSRYVRKSELHFVAAFNALFFQSGQSYQSEGSRALTGLLNTCGFYVKFGPNDPPAGVAARHRYRLKQLLLPGEKMTAYATTAQDDTAWFTEHLDQSVTLAENVILLLAVPAVNDAGLTKTYNYNSRAGAADNPQPATAHQLPPAVDVTMVAIDESSALRMENGETPPAAVESALQGLFTDPGRYDADMKTLQERLAAARPPIGFRIFRAAVPIKEAKWSPD